MSAIVGLSVVNDGKKCTTLDVGSDMDSGYHLLVVKDYSRTVQELPNGEGISSGPFTVGGHQWIVKYYPNGEDLSCADFISLRIHCLDDVMEPVKTKFEFSFVDEVERQKPMHIRSTEPCSFDAKDAFWGYTKFMERDVLERSAHLKEDCFTIRCDIMVCNDLNTQQDAVGTLSDICQHFKILLQDQVGSDVTFEASGELFPAHRCVLAARSKVFKAELFGSMKEGVTSGVIQIKDIEPKVFAALLSFIYTDSFPKLEETNMEEAEKDVIWLQDLFAVADRYDIQQLKFLCENKLSEKIGVSSVASTLALAELHQCHGLKEACLKFIIVQPLSCLETIMETDDWKQITGTYGPVLNELIVKFSSNQKMDKKRKW